jgi:glycosyltransferase involved in cell wall biosynthesis
MKKISVIMPCTLAEYPGAAKDRKRKLERAVDSFLHQDYPEKELIVVSDGCQATVELMHSRFSYREGVHVHKIQAQPRFSGAPRNEGIRLATGEVICYLDSDDFLIPDHLHVISKVNWYEADWCYYDDMVRLNDGRYAKRVTEPAYSRIGTSSIAHKRSLKVVWPNGYGHDWRMIQSCLLGKRCAKAGDGGYVVCHAEVVIGKKVHKVDN